MIKSMSGYGRGSASNSLFIITTEIRTVNHRFSEITLKLPNHWLAAEETVKKEIRSTLKRGSAHVFIQIESLRAEKQSAKIDWDKLDVLYELFEEGQVKYQTKAAFPLDQFMMNESVLTFKEQDIEVKEGEINLLLSSVKHALEDLEKMRIAEGQAIYQSFVTILSTIEASVEVFVREKERILADYTNRLQTRLDDLFKTYQHLDEARLHMEVALLADKNDINEEVERISSHLSQFKSLLDQSVPVGRKLDFMAQELHREANTIGSKTQDTLIGSLVIDVKAEIEKIREQVQNVE